MIPKRLSPGDTIGIAAPSTAVQREMESQLQKGLSLLRSKGFNIKLGQHIRSQGIGSAAAPEQKAEDLNALFADPSVNAIICAQGGETANTSLSLLDWDTIRDHPKIFLGISDITVLLNAIYQKTGLVTFHGNDILWGFGRHTTAYDIAEFDRVLIRGEIGRIPQNSPWKTIREGAVEGRLLGGNLGCLLKLAGTPYWPDFTDAILFIEEYEISPGGCQSGFHHLQQMGVFDQVRGVIVGYIDSMQRDDGSGPYMEDILLEVTSSCTFPILKANDFGHNCPNTVLPVGGQVVMDAGQRFIEVTAPCVQ